MILHIIVYNCVDIYTYVKLNTFIQMDKLRLLKNVIIHTAHGSLWHVRHWTIVTRLRYNYSILNSTLQKCTLLYSFAIISLQLVSACTMSVCEHSVWFYKMYLYLAIIREVRFISSNLNNCIVKLIMLYFPNYNRWKYLCSIFMQ